jgi:Helix-turn-helix domain
MRKTHDKAQADLLVKSAVPRTPTILNEKQAAEYLGFAAGTLRVWRCCGRGPSFLKTPGLRGAVRYTTEDLDRFLAECRHVPSARANAERIFEKIKHRN